MKPDFAVKISSITRKSKNVIGKPNEDYFLVDDVHNIFILCDGVTRSPINSGYPDPSPAAKASEIFAKTAHKLLVEKFSIGDHENALLYAIEKANCEISHYNNEFFPYPDYLENDLASTVAIVSYIANNIFYYAYNGDCIGLVSQNGIIQRFTRLQTAQVAEYRKKVGFTKEATLWIRKGLRNVIEHPMGYGAFTGECKAMDFVERGEIVLQNKSSIILLSDGLLDLLEYKPTIFISSDVETIIQEAEALEVQNNYRSDDKTAIIIQISLCED